MRSSLFVAPITMTLRKLSTPSSSAKWEKPQAKEGFDLEKPQGGTHAWDIPPNNSGANGRVTPASVPVASNANRDALRAIVSRET